LDRANGRLGRQGSEWLAGRIGVHRTLTAVGRELAGFVWALGQALEELLNAAAA
jgi:hypothetical protein